MQATMAALHKALPQYVWLVALPQLCSRMTHAHPDTAALTRSIITRVFVAYPQQVRRPHMREIMRGLTGSFRNALQLCCRVAYPRSAALSRNVINHVVGAYPQQVRCL